MSFVPLVTAWENSRQEREPIPGRQRVASIEYEHGTSARPATFLEWLLDLDRNDQDQQEIDGQDRGYTDRGDQTRDWDDEERER